MVMVVVDHRGVWMNPNLDLSDIYSVVQKHVLVVVVAMAMVADDQS